MELSDRDIERLLAGQQPYGRPDLADVAHHVALLRSMSGFVAPPPMHPELVAQLHKAAVESSGQHPRLEVAPEPEAEQELAEDPAASGAPIDQARRRWRVMGAAAAAVMLAGVAYTGLVTSSKQGEGSPDTKTDRPASAESTPSSSETTDPPPTSAEPPPPATEAPAPPATEAPESTPREEPAESHTNGDEPPPNTAIPPGDFPWPEECQRGDWQCWIDVLNRRPPPDGHGSDGRP